MVPMQNGMDSVGCLRDALGAEHVAGGLCRIFAFIDTPGLSMRCHACARGPQLNAQELLLFLQVAYVSQRRRHRLTSGALAAAQWLRAISISGLFTTPLKKQVSCCDWMCGGGVLHVGRPNPGRNCI